MLVGTTRILSFKQLRSNGSVLGFVNVPSNEGSIPMGIKVLSYWIKNLIQIRTKIFIVMEPREGTPTEIILLWEK